VRTLQAFGIYAAGFVVGPIGAATFGYYRRMGRLGAYVDGMGRVPTDRAVLSHPGRSSESPESTIDRLVAEPRQFPAISVANRL
jgi:hypothetical protein